MSSADEKLSSQTQGQELTVDTASSYLAATGR